MKQLFFIFIFFQILSCKAQELITKKEISTDNLEVGKCFFSFKVPTNEKDSSDTNFENSFILETIPPTYIEKNVKYSCDELRSKLTSSGSLRHITLEAHGKLFAKKSDLSEFTTIKNPIGFLYCMTEVSPHGKTIFEKDLIGDSISITEKRIVSPSKIVKIYVDKKPKNLNKNQIYFEKGMWTTPKEAIVRGCGRRYPFIFDIKKELIKLGYPLILNNEIDEDTKKALINFQRKNNLPEGQIDFKTLEKLGIKVR